MLIVSIIILLALSVLLDGYHRRALQILLLISLGISASAFRVRSIAAPILKAPLERVWVEATISQIQHHGNGIRVWLAHPYIKKLEANYTPKFIRVVVRAKSANLLAVGDRIRVLATLMPPKSAIIPEGFDFAEYAYFKQLGAVGAAISSPIVLTPSINKADGLYIQRLRHFISQRILSRMTQPEAGVAIALLIGDTSYIEPQVIDNFRISGIAHLVAISGMHMVIVVSMIFLTLRRVLARSAYITLHYNNKKISAVCSIFGSFCYLLIAGCPISAQRAFMVSTLFLFAIICDRKSAPMRTLLISAIVLLLITPEALKNPSLQMSYAACIALIASSRYSFALMRNISIPPRKAWRYATGILCSSIIASCATTPFLLYHFHNFSTYGMLTNIIAVPLNDFCIMFLGITGMLLIPLALDAIPFWLMSKAIAIMLYFADLIASLNNASIYISGVTGLALLGIATGGLLMSVGQTRLRYLSIPLAVASIIAGYKPVAADIILPQDGKLFVVKLDGQYYFSNKRGARYAKDVLKQHLGITDIRYLPDISPQCQTDVCTLNIKGMHVMIAGAMYPRSCSNIDIFINLYNESGCPNARYVITKAELEQYGAHLISIDGDNIYVHVAESKAIDVHIKHALLSLHKAAGTLDSPS
ncbi:MAG: ComEC/Rec2 family competence protein [Proteobacteria bacterium]|nr:ComEC/Rec2 family competence protein [Pseudomonadota bacterium]